MSEAGFMSPRCAPLSVLPVFKHSTSASSSRCLSISSPICQRIFPRSEAFIFGQGPDSNAWRAALTARSTSAASPRSTVVRGSPVAGFITSIFFPDAHPLGLPPMKSLPGLRVCVTALASMVKLLFAPSAISDQRSELRQQGLLPCSGRSRIVRNAAFQIVPELGARRVCFPSAPEDKKAGWKIVLRSAPRAEGQVFTPAEKGGPKTIRRFVFSVPPLGGIETPPFRLHLKPGMASEVD